MLGYADVVTVCPVELPRAPRNRNSQSPLSFPPHTPRPSTWGPAGHTHAEGGRVPVGLLQPCTTAFLKGASSRAMLICLCWCHSSSRTGFVTPSRQPARGRLASLGTQWGSQVGCSAGHRSGGSRGGAPAGFWGNRNHDPGMETLQGKGFGEGTAGPREPWGGGRTEPAETTVSTPVPR